MMTEVEFEELMKEIREEFEADLAQDGATLVIESPPIAANDNDEEWPLLPFPDGWTASC